MAISSNPSHTVNLNRNRQMVTRYQERQLRQTFPFLDLPPELRNMIYEYAIDLNGIEKFFDRYYKRLKKTRCGTTPPPRFRRKTPTIFLLNRQCFAEAVSLLSKKSITFRHGLLNLGDVLEIVSEPVLQKLSSITITTKGHPILKKSIKSASWHGFMDLFTDLSFILAEGHKLKNLTVDFEDEALERHVNTCWYGDNRCDFRDHIKEALNDLRSIRGIGCVTITGVPSAVAQELKVHMESKPKSLLDLPGEIRNQIYELCADWSDISTQLARTMKAWTDHDYVPPYPAKTTPTVLLLNRQIYKEAVSVIHSKPLRLEFPVGKMIQKQTDIPRITALISDATLLKVKHLEIRMEEWEWMYSLCDIAPVFFVPHKLDTLHFYFKDDLKPQFTSKAWRSYPDGQLNDCITDLAVIQGIRRVTFEGDLPDVYTQQLVEMMQGPVSDPQKTYLPLFKAVRGDGAIVHVDEMGE